MVLLCYSCVSFRAGEEKAPSRGQFLIAATLGWLFEVGLLESLMSVIKLFPLFTLTQMPNTPTGTFFDQIKSSGRVPFTLSDDPECLVRWLNSAVNFKSLQDFCFWLRTLRMSLLLSCCTRAVRTWVCNSHQT